MAPALLALCRSSQTCAVSQPHYEMGWSQSLYYNLLGTSDIRCICQRLHQATAWPGPTHSHVNSQQPHALTLTTGGSFCRVPVHAWAAHRLRSQNLNPLAVHGQCTFGRTAGAPCSHARCHMSPGSYDHALLGAPLSSGQGPPEQHWTVPHATACTSHSHRLTHCSTAVPPAMPLATCMLGPATYWSAHLDLELTAAVLHQEHSWCAAASSSTPKASPTTECTPQVCNTPKLIHRLFHTTAHRQANQQTSLAELATATTGFNTGHACGLTACCHRRPPGMLLAMLCNLSHLSNTAGAAARSHRANHTQHHSTCPVGCPTSKQSKPRD
jgi:hypothetical protein